MTLFTYITKNQDIIKYCVKIGLMPCTIISHITIYSRYDYYKRLGYGNYDAVLYAAEDSQISVWTVYRIIKKMEAVL